MATQMMYLKHLPADQLSDHIKPVYELFCRSLTAEQKAQVDFNTVLGHVQESLRGKELDLGLPLNVVREKDPGISPCANAIIDCSVDGIMLVIGLIGLGTTTVQGAANALVDDLEETEVIGLQKILDGLDANASFLDKAAAIWKLFKGIYNLTGLGTFLKALKSHMHWYSWLLLGITIVAQLALWFASDGVALVAQLALSVKGIDTFVGAAVAADETCKGHKNPPIPGPGNKKGAQLNVDQELQIGDSLVSSNGDYYALMQEDGNFVIYDKTLKEAVWGTNTVHSGGAILLMQEDGNLVIYKSDRHTPVWASGTVGKGNNCRLLMQDDRNLVIYDANDQAVWASGTVK